MQAPLWQFEPWGQTRLHAPQLFESLDVSTHCVPHAVSVPGQMQVPFWQKPPVGHTLPHPPQLPWELAMSTHWPPHITQVQTPFEHTPLAQCLPHCPQLFQSVMRSVHPASQTEDEGQASGLKSLAPRASPASDVPGLLMSDCKGASMIAEASLDPSSPVARVLNPHADAHADAQSAKASKRSAMARGRIRPSLPPAHGQFAASVPTCRPKWPMYT
jgi:hypothetical protein